MAKKPNWKKIKKCNEILLKRIDILDTDGDHMKETEELFVIYNFVDEILKENGIQ